MKPKQVKKYLHRLCGLDRISECQFCDIHIERAVDCLIHNKQVTIEIKIEPDNQLHIFCP